MRNSGHCLTAVLFVMTCWMSSQAQILPVYDAVPQTSFSCQGRAYGYYADPEVNCQVFHVCPGEWGSGHYSFLCPNQTVFNQNFLVCDHPYNVDCSAAENRYSINDFFGRLDATFDNTI